MTTTTKKITIALSDARPVKIDPAAWPVIAKDAWHSGEYAFQSFDSAWIKVRQHSDGRTLVYGFAGDGAGGSRPNRADISAGYLIPAGDDDGVIRAIRRVAGALTACDCGPSSADCDALAISVIGDLPSVEI